MQMSVWGAPRVRRAVSSADLQAVPARGSPPPCAALRRPSPVPTPGYPLTTTTTQPYAQDCKSKLDKLKRDQAALRANSYNPTSCPVCLEDFATDLDTAQRAAEGASAPSAAAAAAADRAAGASGAAGAGTSGGAAGAGSGGAAGAGLSHQRSGSAGAVAAAAGMDVPLQEVGSFSSAAGASWGGEARGLSGEAAAAGQDGSSKGPQALLGKRAAADAEDRELKEPLMSPRTDAGSSGTGSAAAAAAAAAGGAAAAAAAAGGAAAAPAERRPLVLPCGHAFCEPCIKA